MVEAKKELYFDQDIKYYQHDRSKSLPKSINQTKVRLELQLFNMDKLIRLIDQEGFISFALRPTFLKNLK